jgi:hypothetical protein
MTESQPRVPVTLFCCPQPGPAIADGKLRPLTPIEGRVAALAVDTAAAVVRKYDLHPRPLSLTDIRVVASDFFEGSWPRGCWGIIWHGEVRGSERLPGRVCINEIHTRSAVEVALAVAHEVFHWHLMQGGAWQCNNTNRAWGVVNEAITESLTRGCFLQMREDDRLLAEVLTSESVRSRHRDHVRSIAELKCLDEDEIYLVREHDIPTSTESIVEARWF